MDSPRLQSDVQGSEGPGLRCPLCDYSLQGLPEPRCPECGHRFEWADLTDPARMRLRWFFEHRRWLGGYVGTQWKMMIPWRFWRTLRPAHSMRGWRLVLFFCVGATVFLALTVGVVVAENAGAEARSNAAERAYLMRRPNIPASKFEFKVPPNPTWADIRAASMGNVTAEEYIRLTAPSLTDRSLWRTVLRKWPEYVDGGRPLLAALAGAVALPVGSLFVLGIMRQSMVRAKVRTGHMVRVAVYASDLMPVVIVLLLMFASTIPTIVKYSSFSNPLDRGEPLYLFAVVPIWLIRLENGVRLYLGIRRAWMVPMAAAIIAGFIWYTLVMYAGNLGRMYG